MSKRLTANFALHYELYQYYIEQRHANRDMYPPSVQQFQSFLNTDLNLRICMSFVWAISTAVKRNDVL